VNYENHPGNDPRTALKDAVAFLRGCPRPDGAESRDRGRALREARAREIAALEAWAAPCGLTRDWLDLAPRFREGGAEHDVFQDAQSQRWFKVTKQGGLTVDEDWVLGKFSQQWLAVPFVREATPLEYLERMALFNETFGDDIRLEGVTRKSDGEFAFITSQPDVHGRAAENAETQRFMESLGFTAVPDVCAGRQDSASFFRAADDVAVFDTHGENFFVYEDMVLPIDALILKTSAALSQFLLMAPADRRREVAFRSRLAFRSSK
jgi:Serine/Threonine/Tyrosine Kinase found in polyvalent proteins